uniref:PiggyBac transposable element-derived protein domain-containing protein n=1 Tax=Magallana gigas TaxID=29159 RepID=A0A8W8MQT4_MAGGI
MENSSSDDDSDTLSEGSDLQLFSEHEFSSDTDSDDDTQQTESSMEPDSQQTEATDDDFWSYDLHPVDIAPFTEQYLHINDNQAQAPAGSPNYDRLHKIRPLIDMTRGNFQKFYKPGKCQSIDEGMIRYKGHHYAQQYTPGKPIKRGLKIWMRCEQSGYTNDYRVYLGKHDSMCGPSLGERVVKHLCKPLKWKGHHVFFDRYFTSIPLLQTLESYGVYGCGTIMANRKGFPSQLKNPHLPERGDAEQMQHNNLVATVWNDAKPVHIASTTSDPLGDGPAQRRKTIVHYHTSLSHFDLLTI